MRAREWIISDTEGAQSLPIIPDSMHAEWAKLHSEHLKTKGPWQVTVCEYRPVRVNPATFRWLRVYDRQPCGAWKVWAFRVGGKWYTSMADDIYGYLSV